MFGRHARHVMFGGLATKQDEQPGCGRGARHRNTIANKAAKIAAEGFVTANVSSVKLTIADIAEATRGSVLYSQVNVEVDGVTQDGRELRSGQLFVPLIAERDGHDFIDQALDSGAGAYLSQNPVGKRGVGVLVDDTTQALQDLGRLARSKIPGPVVGITGSVGKTSTKDLLAGAMNEVHPTHASTKSFNNEIGVPLTLLNAPDNTHAAIVEMGARGIGHIELLAAIASPTIGVVTTVVAAHTSEFGSVDNVALAKGELVEALPSEGLAVLNGDNPLVSAMRDRTSAAVLTFGTDPSNNVRIVSNELDDELRPTIVMESDWGPVTARPQARGAHMAMNVAAATATALWLGVPPEAVENGLANAEMSPWRMEVSTGASGALIINDTYNANPTSMRSALASLAALPQRRKVAVLGYMGELGPIEADAHGEIADEVAREGIELIATGTELYGLVPAGNPSAYLVDLDEDTAVLVKGSRSAGLETVAAELLERSS